MHIGLFDSGVGGLTVLRELKTQIPGAHFTYLGDTARLPYGNKAPETLKKYTAENIDFLDSQGVDVIVIACHSASSVALDLTESPQGTPVLNVITPSCLQAKSLSKSGSIGILATKATTRSGVYPQYINSLGDALKVTSQEAPLLVPLVEEGLMEDEVTEFILKRYLEPMKAAQVDTMILGCTHYPILKPQISKISGADVTLVDPAVAVAEKILEMKPTSADNPRFEVYLTDHAPHFLEHAQSLLGDISKVSFLFPEG